MEYNFFLFFNLYSANFPEINDLEYDVMYEYIQKQYDYWLQFDKIPKYRDMGTYESMEAYISKIKG
jgi:hypothetical protein